LSGGEAVEVIENKSLFGARVARVARGGYVLVSFVAVIVVFIEVGGG
jgi:hypothetical protein